MTTPTDQLPVRLAKGDPAPEDGVLVPLHGPGGPADVLWGDIVTMLDVSDYRVAQTAVQVIADAAEAPLPLRKGDRGLDNCVVLRYGERSTVYQIGVWNICHPLDSEQWADDRTVDGWPIRTEIPERFHFANKSTENTRAPRPLRKGDLKATPKGTELVLWEVARERNRQDIKWGQQNHDPFSWLAILMEEVGEAAQAAVQSKFEPGKLAWTDYRAEMVQVAAVAVSMIECFDRNVARIDDEPEPEAGGNAGVLDAYPTNGFFATCPDPYATTKVSHTSEDAVDWGNVAETPKVERSHTEGVSIGGTAPVASPSRSGTKPDENPEAMPDANIAEWTPSDGQLVERISDGECFRLRFCGIGSWAVRRLRGVQISGYSLRYLRKEFRPRFLRVGDVISAVNEDTSHPVAGEAIIAFTPQGLTTDFHCTRHNHDIVVHIEGLGPVPWPPQPEETRE